MASERVPAPGAPGWVHAVSDAEEWKLWITLWGTAVILALWSITSGGSGLWYLMPVGIQMMIAGARRLAADHPDVWEWGDYGAPWLEAYTLLEDLRGSAVDDMARECVTGWAEASVKDERSACAEWRSLLVRLHQAYLQRPGGVPGPTPDSRLAIETAIEIFKTANNPVD